MLEKMKSFCKGPWPCLNKAADHYKQPVIQHVNITRDYKSSAPYWHVCVPVSLFMLEGAPIPINQARIYIALAE